MLQSGMGVGGGEERERDTVRVPVILGDFQGEEDIVLNHENK